jgi:3-hydroxyisobutyrate dehydrogenase-like beta-hydroxyacid dehydrogenase
MAVRTVGFVGLGTMGGPMAANLVKAGFEVSVTTDHAPRSTGWSRPVAAGRRARGRLPGIATW